MLYRRYANVLCLWRCNLYSSGSAALNGTEDAAMDPLQLLPGKCVQNAPVSLADGGLRQECSSNLQLLLLLRHPPDVRTVHCGWVDKLQPPLYVAARLHELVAFLQLRQSGG